MLTPLTLQSLAELDADYYLDYVQFRGISPLSKLIKFFTRSKYSHTAIMLPDGRLVEAWNHNGGPGIYWGHSDFEKHTRGTQYDVFRLPVTKRNRDCSLSYYRGLALNHWPYNYVGVLGFVFHSVRGSRKGLFCSEGAVTPLLKTWCCCAPICINCSTFIRTSLDKPHCPECDGRSFTGSIDAWKVSPDIFSMLLMAAGGQVVFSDVV